MFLATTLQGSILDLIVVALLIFFSLVGLRQGFVNRVVGIVAGTISFAIALALCKPFANLLNAMFGMTDSLSASITKFFAKTESYNVVVSDAVEFKQLLKLKDVEFLPSFVMDAVVKMANVQKGKTIAQIADELEDEESNISYIVNIMEECGVENVDEIVEKLLVVGA